MIRLLGQKTPCRRHRVQSSSVPLSLPLPSSWPSSLSSHHGHHLQRQQLHHLQHPKFLDYYRSVSLSSLQSRSYSHNKTNTGSGIHGGNFSPRSYYNDRNSGNRINVGNFNNNNSPRIFVSRYNNSLNLSANDIIEYCRSQCIGGGGSGRDETIRQTSTHVVVRECPFCVKPTMGKLDNMYKLYIQIGSGAYFCHRCGAGGSWYDLKSQLGSVPSSSSHVAMYGDGGQQAGSRAGGGTRTNHYNNYNGGRNNGSDDGRYGVSTTSHQTHFQTHHQHNSAAREHSYNDHHQDGNDEIPCLPLPTPRLSGYYSSRLLDDNNNKNSVEGGADCNVLTYLETARGLTKSTLRKYGVGRATYKFPSEQGGYQDAECVTFPWIMRESDVQLQESLRGATFKVTKNANNDDKDVGNTDSEDEKQGKSDEHTTVQTTKEGDSGLVSSDATSAPTGAFVTRRIKVRALQQKSWQRLDPPGGGWGLFGLHTVPDDATEVVLTEGEYDAMAVSQATGRPAVSLPNGCRSLPVQVLPLLERFKKIYLWMDNDQPGQEGAEKFARKLGLDRCYIVHCTEAKDANEALLKGTVDLNEKLQQAKLVPHDRILTFEDLRHDVLHELLEPDKYSGVPIPSLPKFTQLVKGFRRGELTVLTGPTGSGKTTFLGQVSLDLAEQGINVLWGSFEIKNTRLLHKLLRQFSRGSLPDSKTGNSVEILESIFDRFQSLPLYFMRFHGGSDVDEVLDAMEYAVYVNDVEHIVLDNMQFMISRNTQKSSFDKFDIQDVAIEKFRKFATDKNVHVTLVVHPRKEDESSKLGISSFYGSAKATQEADTVLILQNDGRRKYVDVKKNRFDGTLGYSPLYFQSSSGRYVENEMEGDRSQSQSATQHQPSNPKARAAPVRSDLENHWQFTPNVFPQPRA